MSNTIIIWLGAPKTELVSTQESDREEQYFTLMDENILR